LKITKAIEKSFPAMEKLFEKEKLKAFIDCEHKDLPLYHFGLGTWVRNNLLKRRKPFI